MIKLTRFKYLLILGFILTLTACSIKTLYNNLDWVLSGMVDDYVTLSDAQEVDVEKQIKHLLKWHRTTQLEIYARDLEEIKSYTQAGLNSENLDIIFAKINGNWNTIRAQAAPKMADLFLSLSEKQHQELSKRFAKQNKELQEEFDDSTVAKRKEKSADKLIDNFDEWLSSLSDAQETALKGWPDNFHEMHPHRMAFRKAWQAELLKILADKTIANEDKKALLIKLIVMPEDYQSEEHKLKLKQNMEQFKSLMATFDQSVTAEQKQYLAKRLDTFKKAFQELAKEE